MHIPFTWTTIALRL